MDLTVLSTKAVRIRHPADVELATTNVPHYRDIVVFKAVKTKVEELRDFSLTAATSHRFRQDAIRAQPHYWIAG